MNIKDDDFVYVQLKNGLKTFSQMFTKDWVDIIGIEYSIPIQDVKILNTWNREVFIKVMNEEQNSKTNI